MKNIEFGAIQKKSPTAGNFNPWQPHSEGRYAGELRPPLVDLIARGLIARGLIRFIKSEEVR